MQGIFAVELWGGPMDGTLVQVSNPTESLEFPHNPKFNFNKPLDRVLYDKILYDFSYQLPTKTLLYKIRKEVEV